MPGPGPWLKLDEFLGRGWRGGIGPLGGMPPIMGRWLPCEGIRGSGEEMVGEDGGMRPLGSPPFGLLRLTILRL